MRRIGWLVVRSYGPESFRSDERVSDSEIDSSDGTAGAGALKQAGGLTLWKACSTERLERLSGRTLFVMGWLLMAVFKAVVGVRVRTPTATRNEVRGE